MTNLYKHEKFIHFTGDYPAVHYEISKKYAPYVLFTIAPVSLYSAPLV